MIYNEHNRKLTLILLANLIRYRFVMFIFLPYTGHNLQFSIKFYILKDNCFYISKNMITDKVIAHLLYWKRILGGELQS